MSRLIDIIVRGLRADQPALPSSDAVPGSLYYVTDEQVTERVADDGLTWEDFTDTGGGGGGGVAIAAGTQTATTSTIVFSNSNGITFGMSGSTRITASHNGLTTAMASNAGSNFVAATAAFAGTSASGTIASNGISISIGPYLTTAMQSNAVTLSNLRVSAGTTSNLLSAITFSNASGVSFGINASVVTASVKTDYQTSGNYLTTAMASNAGSNFVAATAAFAGTNASGTIASDGISVSVAPPSAGSVNFSAGTTSGNLTAVTFADSNGVSFGLDAGTITATVRTNYQSAGAYLTTAMASNRGSDFVQATAVFNGTNASGTIASGAISVSVGNYITTARASTDAIGLATAQTNVTWTVNSNGLSFNAAGYAGIGFTSTTTAGTAIVGTHNTAGLSLGVPNYLTTARASTDAIGLNTAQSNVTWTVNSSGLSFDARGYAGTGTSATNASVTLNSNGLAISVAAPGAASESNWVLLTGNTAGNTTASGSSIAWSGGNGVTLSGTNGSVVGISVNTYSTVGTATTGYPVASANSIGTITRWAAEDHRHAGIGGIGISTAGNTSGFTGSNVGTYWLQAVSGITIVQTTSNNGSHSLELRGPVYSLDYFAYPNNWAGMVTGASAITQTSGSSLWVQPFAMPYHVNASYVRLLASFNDNAVGTAGTTQANTTFSCERYTTVALGLHARIGTNLLQLSSTSVGITGRTIYSAGNTGSFYTMTLQKTYPQMGSVNAAYTTSYAATSNSIAISSQSNTLFTGPQFLDIPWASNVPIGALWWVLGASTSSLSNSSNISFVGTGGMAISLAGVSQSNVSVGLMGAATSASAHGLMMGLGVQTTNAAQISRTGVGISSVSQVVSNPQLLFQIIGGA
jgi:hypothetical protein